MYGLAFGIPKFNIASYGEISHGLVNLCEIRPQSAIGISLQTGISYEMEK